MFKNATQRVLAATTAATLAIGTTTAFTTAPACARDLAQTVTSDEKLAPAGEFTVIGSGHVDLGTTLIDGEAQLLARDDTGLEPVWRAPQDMVLRLGDSAVQTLPEGKNFGFVGAKPGEQVWVVPQTEIADVPWLGWNTQAPSLIEAVDRGMEITFLGHTGPGEFSLFLHNSGFGEPDVLFSTAKPAEDSFWVDLNTHTHANWTFTEPGIHQVGLKFTAQRKDGTPLEVQGAVTFAVGEDTDPTQAQGMEWNAGDAQLGGVSYWLLGVGAAVLALALLLALGLALRGRKGAADA